ncbi:MAG: signal peptidase I, partial [Firmicutes bacterium]|nr:signal peptidase I [Bacillota bacterium]
MKYLPTWLKKVLSILSQLLFIALIITGGLVIFHNFYFTPIKIVGSSMEPTLVNQEFGVMDQNPQTIAGLTRFDIVIVQQNPTVNRYLIKRLIGLPGETIALQNDGSLLVNGLLIEQDFLPDSGYQERTCTNMNAIGCVPLTL